MAGNRRKQAVNAASRVRASAPKPKASPSPQRGKPSAPARKPSVPSRAPVVTAKKPSGVVNKPSSSNKKPSSTTNKKERIANLTKKARDLIKSGQSPKDLMARLRKQGADKRVANLQKLRDKVRKAGITPETPQTPETPEILSAIGSPNYPITGVSETDIMDIYGNPDEALGSSPAEMDYATSIDPYKIEAKSRERLGALQAGLGAYLGRLQAGSSERINRASRAAELLGSKLAYGTEYDINKVNRLSALQQAKTQQATSLYNLIPSAFG